MTSDQACLLIVDPQPEFLNAVPGLEQKLLGLVRSFPGRIILTEFQVQSGTAFVDRLGLSEGAVSPARAAFRSRASNVIVKKTYSPARADIEQIVSQEDEILLAGCDTEACVLATAFLLWDMAVPFYVAKGYTGSSGGDCFKKFALEVMRRSFGADSVVSI